MPFGLTNGPTTFIDSFINEVFIDYLDHFMTAFIAFYILLSLYQCILSTMRFFFFPFEAGNIV